MLDVARIWQVVIAVLLSIAGGFARLLNTKHTIRLQKNRILADLFVSGFAGLMVLLLARSFGLSDDWIALVCGVAGWLGPQMLNFVAKPAGKAIGLEINLDPAQGVAEEEPVESGQG